MPHHYRCPTCGTDKFLDVNQPRPAIQMRCEKAKCFGRLEWLSSLPGPIPPPRPVAPTALAIAAALTPVTLVRNGGFCNYTLTFDRSQWLVSFVGTAGARNYAFTLDTDFEANSRCYFEPPGHTLPGDLATPINEFFVFNPLGDRDWILPPKALPMNDKGGAQKNQVVSIGHGTGLTRPIRVQIGSQNVDEQHQGSGLIHMMFAHDRTNLQSVLDLLRTVLGDGCLGAIYCTLVPLYGHLRYIFLSRAAKPNCLVTELHDTHFRVITLYKLDGAPVYVKGVARPNKFAAGTAEYKCLYSWDKGKF